MFAIVSGSRNEITSRHSANKSGLQISPRWNDLVTVYLSRRQNLPVIERFYWSNKTSDWYAHDSFCYFVFDFSFDTVGFPCLFVYYLFIHFRDNKTDRARFN